MVCGCKHGYNKNKNTMSYSEYEKALTEIVERAEQARFARGEFRPFGFYNPDGDGVEFFMSQEDYYAENINTYLTLYFSKETNKIMGFWIGNIAKILKHVTAEEHEIFDL
jgi:hypothetical protein